jgi:hypothetical protein
LVRDYSQAIVAGDGTRACALMTPISRARFATRPGRDCADFHRSFSGDAEVRNAYRTFTIRRLTVDGKAAEVELSRPGDESVSFALARRGDRWLLDFEAPGRAVWVQDGREVTIGDRIASPGPTVR